MSCGALSGLRNCRWRLGCYPGCQSDPGHCFGVTAPSSFGVTAPSTGCGSRAAPRSSARVLTPGTAFPAQGVQLEHSEVHLLPLVAFLPIHQAVRAEDGPFLSLSLSQMEILLTTLKNLLHSTLHICPGVWLCRTFWVAVLFQI